MSFARVCRWRSVPLYVKIEKLGPGLHINLVLLNYNLDFFTLGFVKTQFLYKLRLCSNCRLWYGMEIRTQDDSVMVAVEQ